MAGTARYSDGRLQRRCRSPRTPGCGSGSTGESVTWSSNTNVTVISNGYTAANGYCTGGNVPCDTATDSWGNACDGGGSWQSNGTTYYGIAGNSSDTEDYFGSGGTPIQTNTVECTVPSNHQNVTLTGAGMVEAIMPNTFSAALGDGPGVLKQSRLGCSRHEFAAFAPIAVKALRS